MRLGNRRLQVRVYRFADLATQKRFKKGRGTSGSNRGPPVLQADDLGGYGKRALKKLWHRSSACLASMIIQLEMLRAFASFLIARVVAAAFSAQESK